MRGGVNQGGTQLPAQAKWKQQSHMLRAAMAAARGDAHPGDMLTWPSISSIA